MMIYELATEQHLFAGVDMGAIVCVAVMKVIMGMRPPFPDRLHKTPHKLMESCWKADPHLRPTFKEAVKTIREAMLASDEDNE